MAQFDTNLEATPTQTVGSSPVVISQEGLGIAQAAQAFTGMFLDFKAKEKKQEVEDARAKLLAGVTNDIIALGQASEQQGGLSLQQAKVGSLNVVRQAIERNPSLTKEIQEAAASARTLTGLGGGKTSAQLRAEEFTDRRKAIIESGRGNSQMTDNEVAALEPSLQAQQQSENTLKQIAQQHSVALSGLNLDKNQKDAINARTEELLKTEVRKIAVSEQEMFSTLAESLLRQNGDSIEGRKKTVEALEARAAQIRAQVGGAANAFLKQDEIEDMLAGVLGPIDILRKSVEEGKDIRWINKSIELHKSQATLEFYNDPNLKKLAILSKELGPTVFETYAKETAVRDYIGKIVNDGGGSGTDGIAPEDKQKAVEFIKEFAKNSKLSDSAKEDLNSSISGVIKDAVTDNAQGRLVKPGSIGNVIDMLSDPTINQKVANGSIVVSEDDRQRGRVVVQTVYADKIEPKIREIFSTPSPLLDGQPVGNFYTPTIKGGALTMELSPEGKKLKEAFNTKLRESVPVSVGSSLETSANKQLLRDRERDVKILKDINDMVKAANSVGMAMATLNKQTDPSSTLNELMEGILSGQED